MIGVDKLTLKQKECYEYMLSYLCEHHSVPTIEAIAEHFNIFPNAIADRIKGLVRKGWVEKFRCSYKIKNIKLFYLRDELK